MAYLSLYLRYTYIVIFTVYFFMISDVYLEYIQQLYTSVIPRDVYRDMRIRATFSIYRSPEQYQKYARYGTIYFKHELHRRVHVL